MSDDYEKLGVFYLGREHDPATRTDHREPLLYDDRHLTTHAVCVGMTGSGKTGLCVALLEEAAIDGIPAIIIDPKGDLGNLLLAFPELRPADFRPWIDESEATRKQLTPDQLAEQTAQKWREGLADWDQDGARIERFKSSADIAIYTPGSTAGLPITVLRSFAAPPPEILADGDMLRERIVNATAGVLALVGIEADPLRSREHILISQLLDQAWRQSQNLDLAGLVRLIQSPPLERIGSADLESFYPAKDRAELAMRLNSLLASPAFAGWMEGEPLDVARLLHTPEGKPRLSIMSIAHLSDAERMFFVTILLNEILAWVRTQSGTSSLRAILYMDEIFGYFPPSANPPSKLPMLTLLKQARAYGLGIVLATQNPVDLDYKGLSNAGTWFLGRLQTERDKARVLDGLEGASTAAGKAFDRAQMEATLGGLGNRVFLLNDVHEEHPVVFRSRWCLSYLRGPLSRKQIQNLMAPRKTAAPPAKPITAAETPSVAATTTTTTAAPRVAGTMERPLAPPEVSEVFLIHSSSESAPENACYQPARFANARLHFVDSKAGVDCWRDVVVLAGIDSSSDPESWLQARFAAPGDFKVESKPKTGYQFAPLPAPLARAKSYAEWTKSLKAYLYSDYSLSLWSVPAIKEYSTPVESEADFRVRMQQRARELRDEAVEKLRRKYAAKMTTLKTQLQRAEQKVAREQSELQSQTVQSAVSVGSWVLRAIFGRKLMSGTNVTGAATAARSASRATQQRGDVSRANEQLEEIKHRLADLEDEINIEIAHIGADYKEMQIEPYPVSPRKADIAVDKVVLAWVV